MRACVTGYRPDKLTWKYDENDIKCILLKQTLALVIAKVVGDGVDHFYSGMAEGVDTYFAEEVYNYSKKMNKEIKLTCVIPHKRQCYKWSKEAKERYYKILEKSEMVLINEEYTRSCFYERNQYMVDNVDVVIAVFDGKKGGTLQTVKYALKKDKKVICVNPDTMSVNYIKTLDDVTKNTSQISIFD